MQRLQNLKSSREEDKTSLESRYKQRLKEMDTQIKANAKKERQYAKLERLQARSQETCQRLQTDIATIKHQKVCLALPRLPPQPASIATKPISEPHLLFPSLTSNPIKTPPLPSQIDEILYLIS